MAGMPLGAGFTYSLDVGCKNRSQCSDTDGIIYQLWLSHHFLNNDNEIVNRILNYESSDIGQRWAIEALPIRYMSTESVWARNSNFMTKLYFQNFFDETRPASGPRTFEIRVASTKQLQLWSTVKSAPKGMR